MGSLIPITAAEFEAWQPCLKVIEHDYPRRFASLKLGAAAEVALSWRSNLIEPTIVSNDPGCVWIGIDQRAVCVTRQGAIRFSAGLSSALLNIQLFPEIAVVVCDDEILVVNLEYTIRAFYNLSEIPSDVELTDEGLLVTFIDGSKENFLC